MNVSARFGLPLLHAGQAQKEISNNEALTIVDTLVQPCAESIGSNLPPNDPESGQCWIIGTAPQHDWTGQARALASWTANGWRFVAPREGMTAWVADESLTARYSSGAWQLGTMVAAALIIEGEQVVGAREAAIDDPDGGMVVDVEARMAIEGVLTALRTHGLIDAV